jgi:DNA integrity scanning protein DisA with diadenylate cyclase activity
VQIKDRYDLRNATDPTGMRVETRLHHLIDAKVLDAVTLARLAALDGATVLDAEANLLAYGAIVMSHDSQHEGARTAAAKTLSEVALAVMKVSVDGDITVFTGGEVLARLLTQSRRK